jgi:Mg-chelatase subunit ChlD
MATGVFVLLLVMMMPSYRRSFDAQAAIEAIRVSTATTVGQVQAVEAGFEALRGRAEAAQAAAANIRGETAELLAQARALDARVPVPAAFQAPADRSPQVVDELDLVFIVDTTASMRPVLHELAVAMGGIVRILERLVPSVRVAIAAYSDHDTGLTPLRVFPLTPTDAGGLQRTVHTLMGLSAATVGSLTTDEDLHLGVNAAVAMPFRRGARQALIVMTDAPPHDWAKAQVLAQARSWTLADADHRSLSTLFIWTPNARQNEAGARAFLEQLAAAGGGTYHEHTGGLIENILLSVLTK